MKIPYKVGDKVKTCLDMDHVVRDCKWFTGVISQINHNRIEIKRDGLYMFQWTIILTEDNKQFFKKFNDDWDE